MIKEKDKNLTLKLKNKYKDEQVFVIPFMLLSGIKSGFTEAKNETNIWSKYDTNGKYIYRYDAEYNPTFQQLIPYILIQHPQNKKFYISERIKGEERLQSKLSLGFGGHLNPVDGLKDILFNGLFREMHEELYIEPLSKANFLGYVRNLKSETNDHIGCVFLIEAKEVSIKEINNLKGEWMSIEDLENKYFYFEDWARSIINYLVENKSIFK